MRALILGATGVVGRRAALELARSPEVDILYVASRRLAASKQLARALDAGNGKIRPVAVDILDRATLTEAIAKADVVASCAGPGYGLEVQAADAAVKAQVPYVSLCDDAGAAQEVRQLHDEATGRGVTIVSGCGLAPGISNLLVALAAEELDKVEAIDIALARSPAEWVGSATALHFLSLLSEPAPVFPHGNPTAPALNGTPKSVYFPEPVGWIETFHCNHPETSSLGRIYSDLMALQYRIGLTHKATMDAARSFVASPFSRNHRSRNMFLTLSRTVSALIERKPAGKLPWSAVRVDVRGTRRMRPVTVSLGATDHIVNFASVALTRAAIELGMKRAIKPGSHSPDEVFEIKPFLREVSAKGIRIARLEPSS